jgi:RNA polymerase sigma-70 factor, ECF subfamily
MAPSIPWTLPGMWPVVASTGSDPALGGLSDPALVEACVAGREGAFDVVVERHQRAIYQLCYRFVGTHEDASDLSQEVFLRAYRGLRTFRGQSSLATWLYRIGVNVCLNRVSSKASPGTNPKTTDQLEADEHVDTRSDSPSDRLLREEQHARVRAAIAELPKKQRAALILRMYHDMSHQEIAAVLGTSVGAVKTNFFHALSNLKKRLGGEQI